MVEFITNVNSAVNGFVWGVPMLVLLVGTGILMTILTKFFQLSHLGHWFKNTVGGIFHDKHVTKHTEAGDQSISQFQSLCTALAATIGTGNIVGVASALVAGGPGAIFWMWVVAFFGMMTNYSENVLGIYYRRRNSRGEWSGGAMYYLKDGLGSYKGCKQIGAVLAVLFSAFCLLASFGIGNMSQVNSIAANMTSAFSIPATVTGIVLGIIGALVIVGGLKRIAAVTEKLVPFMALLYILLGLGVVCINFHKIPMVFRSIFYGAFSPSAVTGGAVGSMIISLRKGVSRGIFSNEAGCGTSPTSHAAADTKSPHHQGMYGIFEVFCDTIVLCTMTALVLLIAEREYGILSWGGDNMTLLAFGLYGGKLLYGVLAISVVLFAYATILAQLYYGDTAIRYFGEHKWARRSFVAGMLCVTMVGAVADASVLWRIADVLVCVMTTVNTAFLFGRRREIGESARMGMLEADEKAG